jgi:undecaprenyl diphosphate synthase
VNALFELLRLYVGRDLERLVRENVRVRVIGERSTLKPDLLEIIARAEARTKDNTGLNLIIAFNYGGQSEIARAARAIAEDAVKGLIDPASIDEKAFAGYLDTAGLPDPDLVIRTSGEQRISNFLLWQAAYAELIFVDILWPDFDRAALERAIDEFHRRERRYGGSGEP